MAKFNQIKTVNRSCWPAYRMKPAEELTTAVLTTMLGEPKYYGSTDERIVQLATRCAAQDPDYLCRLAAYARNTGNLRSVSHVLTAVIAHEAREFTRITIRNVVVRPDDITEIMSCYAAMYGKPFPNAMKREVANVIQKFDEYQLAKCPAKNHALKLRDVLRITHPTPKDEAAAALFRKVMDDTLEVPYTWETELSAKGNTCQVWNKLIASGKVGYMALLRNLRNIVTSGANVKPVLAILADPERVRKSRQLPFRFYSAYRTLKDAGVMTPEIHRALDAALSASVANMETLPGRTLLAIDNSGSMSSAVSAKSTVRCCDIAALLGAMANRICEDATVLQFDSAGYWGSTPEGYTVSHYGKHDSILDICERSAACGGSTDLTLPMKYALEVDFTRDVHPYDRIIYFSDNECNSSYHGMARTVQGLADQYRTQYNKNCWVHGVDLQGYGTQQFCGDRFNLIAGWSESVLGFIRMAENGFGSMVTTIADYPLK